MSVIVDVVNAVVSFQQTVSDFMNNGIVTLFQQFTAWFIEWYAVAQLKWKLIALNYSYGVAQQLLSNLNISGMLNAAYSNINSEIMSAMIFLRIPDAINMLISAFTTRFVYRFLGFN